MGGNLVKRGGVIGRLLAGVAIGCAVAFINPGPAAAQSGAVEDAVANTATKLADKVVLDDIEKTLRGLSDHIDVGSKRITVKGAATRAGGGHLPERIDLTVGASMNVDLPAEAQEVVVGDSSIIDVATVNSKRRVFIMARKIGRSNVFILDGSANVIARVEVQVGVDGDSISTAIKRVFPDEAIDVSPEGAAVVLSGKVSSDAVAGRAVAIARRFVEKDDKVVNLLRVGREQQVLLQVRVAEVQRTVLKEIGANGSFGPGTPILGKMNLSGTMVAQGLSQANSAAGTFVFNGIKDILLTLSMLESRGLVRNLAEPNLVAVSGESANMLAGGEVPIPVAGKDGEIKLEFKPFGVMLAFLPVVMDSGRINLKMTTEVSALSDVGSVSLPIGGTATLEIPAFTVRRAGSTVELPDGGSLMMAGLIQNDVISNLSGLPGVMDVPVFGQLFKSDSFRRNETELVVFVTANLVRPTAPSAMVSPTDSLSPGGDLDMWLFGKMLGSYTPGYRYDRARDKQPVAYGFTLDEVLP